MRGSRVAQFGGRVAWPHLRGTAHQPMYPVQIAIPVALGVTLLTHCYGFDDVSAAFNGSRVALDLSMRGT